MLAGCGGGGGPSSGSIGGPPSTEVQVSGATPFNATCGNPGTIGGTVTLNAEVEPQLAVNPTNTANLVGVWQQDRWSNSGSQGTLAGFSLDGGLTWSRPTAPGFSRCSGGTYERASDPWVTFTPDGVAWQSAIAFTGPANTLSSTSAVLVSHSTDGGRTWQAVQTLALNTNDGYFNDKDAITADPNKASNIYVVWDQTPPSAFFPPGPVWFARTINGGATWDAARKIYDPGTTAQTLGNEILVLPAGTLVNALTYIQLNSATPVFSLAAITSSNFGLNWSSDAANAVIPIAPMNSVATIDPVTGVAVREGSDLGTFAVAPSGAIVAAWESGVTTSYNEIRFSISIDGGQTWSTPVAVNGNRNVPAFTPTLTVRSDGEIGLMYYDMRPVSGGPASGSAAATSLWLARSADNGATWIESRIAGPFDLTKAPNVGGYFVGDYQGLASVGTVFLPFYVRTDAGAVTGPTDVFTNRINVAKGMAAAGMAHAYSARPATAPTPEVLSAASDNVRRVLLRRYGRVLPP